jgi:hypothetical protein
MFNLKGTGTQANRNIVKIALASQADLKKFSGGKRHGGDNGISRRTRSGSARHGWIFPDLTYGKDFLRQHQRVRRQDRQAVL